MSAEHGKLGEGKDSGDPLALAVIFRVSRLGSECFGSRSPERETESTEKQKAPAAKRASQIWSRPHLVLRACLLLEGGEAWRATEPEE